MRGDGGLAGEGRVVGSPEFHSWGKCTMSLTNINSDWMSNLWPVNYLFTQVLPLSCILGCNIKCTSGMLSPPFSAWRNWYLCFASFGQCLFTCTGSYDGDSLMILSILSGLPGTFLVRIEAMKVSA